MAESMWATPRIREAFYHEKLGAVLVCDTLFGVGEGEGKPQGEVTLLRTPCDGDPAYLNLLIGWLAEHCTEKKPTFSAN